MSLDVLVHDTHSPGRGRRPGRPARVLLVVLVVLAVGWLTWQSWPRSSGLPLDPDNPDPTGTRAVAQVLRDHDVEVEVVHDRDRLAATTLDDDTTLVVTAGPMLTSEGLTSVGDVMDQAGGLVLVGLRDDALASLDLPVQRTGSDDGEPRAACSDPLASGLDRISPVGSGYEPTETIEGARSCFPTGQGHGHALLRLPGDDASVPVDLLAPADIVTNATVTTQDDAALALRLLGQRPRVVWYSPDASDLRAGDTTVGEPRIAPPWWTPLLVLLGGTVLLTAWWRGRRLGPLAEEPLPVLVPAAETTLARARLYRRAGRRGQDGRSHAADVLRAATRRRLADRMGLPRGATAEQLAAAVEPVVGRGADGIRDLLAGPPPATDHDLAALAADLTRLEEEVSHP